MQTALEIKEHYTDIGGANDHVFGLCHLFGFRFAPRIRDLKERKLYLLPEQKAPTSLKPIAGGVIDTEHITAHWDELLRLSVVWRLQPYALCEYARPNQSKPLSTSYES